MFKEDADFIDDGKLFHNTGPLYAKLRFERQRETERDRLI